MRTFACGACGECREKGGKEKPGGHRAAAHYSSLRGPTAALVDVLGCVLCANSLNVQTTNRTCVLAIRQLLQGPDRHLKGQDEVRSRSYAPSERSFERRRAARELDDELQFHVANETDTNSKKGMSPTEARRTALDGRIVVARPRQRNHPDFPLRGFVRCDTCGRPLTGSWSKRRHGHDAYYQCQRQCRAVNVSEAQLEGAFADELALLQPTAVYMRLLKDRILHVREQRPQKAVHAIQRLDSISAKT